MKTHIIAIHGLNNKPRQESLLARWRSALDEGLNRNQAGRGIGQYELEMVYWADLNYPTPLSDDDAGYTYQPYDANTPLPEYTSEWADDLVALGRQTAGGVLDFLGVVAKREILSDDLLAKLYADLAKYYQDSANRAAVQGRLAAALQAREGRNDEQLIVLSHSMGTIVAMDVLRSLDGNAGAPRVAAFITMGSPLGLPYVVYQQKKSFGKPAAPECVAQWLNFSDKRDRICFDTHLADDYAANSQGVDPVDDLIRNSHKSNPHDGHGYLRCPELSRFLAGVLTR